MAKKPPKAKQLKINWHVPNDLHTKYATNIVVQHTPTEFVINFFEVRPPIILGSSEDIQETVAGIDSVEAKCVGRIVVAPDKVKEFIAALTTNLNNYNLTYKAPVGSETIQ